MTSYYYDFTEGLCYLFNALTEQKALYDSNYRRVLLLESCSAVNQVKDAFTHLYSIIDQLTSENARLKERIAELEAVSNTK